MLLFKDFSINFIYKDVKPTKSVPETRLLSTIHRVRIQNPITTCICIVWRILTPPSSSHYKYIDILYTILAALYL